MEEISTLHPQLEHFMVGNMPMFIEAIKDEHRIQSYPLEIWGRLF
jgi:hypothetical protein